MSILLVSLLIGVGYDAYCVYGIAPKEITSKNEALMECEFLDSLRQKDQTENAKEEVLADDGIFQKRITESSFDKAMIENEKKKTE